MNKTKPFLFDQNKNYWLINPATKIWHILFASSNLNQPSPNIPITPFILLFDYLACSKCFFCGTNKYKYVTPCDLKF